MLPGGADRLWSKAAIIENKAFESANLEIQFNDEKGLSDTDAYIIKSSMQKESVQAIG